MPVITSEGIVDVAVAVISLAMVVIGGTYIYRKKRRK